MNVSIEFEGWTDAKARRMVDTIFDTTSRSFKISDEKDIPIYQALDFLAEERLRSIKAIKGSYSWQPRVIDSQEEKTDTCTRVLSRRFPCIVEQFKLIE